VTTAQGVVTVEWPAEPGLRYEVFRALADSLPGAYEKLGSKPTASGRYVDRTVEAGKVYAYQVAAAGAVRRSLPGFNQPGRPGGLLASVEGAREVRLSWKPDPAADVVGYRVYRARGAEVEEPRGQLLTAKPLGEPRLVDRTLDLSDGVMCSYWVTAVNRAGIESGASPLARTFPDAPRGLVVPEGVGPADGVGNRLNYVVGWNWPDQVKVAGFNVYHATENIDTLLVQGGYGSFWKLWTKVNEKPVESGEIVFPVSADGPRNHYFYVRAVNVLGQEGFYSDLVSPTDRRFRP
jgi:hypothetical protein